MMSNEGDDVKAATYHSSYAELRFKSLFDEESRRSDSLAVVLLGSASWAAQHGLTESLLGRFELLNVPHWSYNECRQAFDWTLYDYLKFGGYPAPAVYGQSSSPLATIY